MEEIHPLEHHETQIEAAENHAAADNVITTKRQRRPSVRLGEIGDILFQEAYRRPKQWKSSGSKEQAGKSSKTRKLAKLRRGSYHHDNHEETLDLLENENMDLNFDNIAIGSWRTQDSKSKRAVKKPRTNWLPKIDEGGASNAEGETKSGRGDDDDEMDEALGVRSPSKEQLGSEGNQIRRSNNSSSRVRVEEETGNHHHHIEADLNGLLEINRSQDGVKNWLESLGLGKYSPVFEMHEVDEEVLPLLTLEDLKDMGINAVGSRRKTFAAIQKLRKGFS